MLPTGKKRRFIAQSFQSGDRPAEEEGYHESVSAVCAYRRYVEKALQKTVSLRFLNRKTDLFLPYLLLGVP